jgi:hypothetical protein
MKSQSYNDVDFCANILFTYIYNQTDSKYKCLEYKIIDINNFDIKNFKKNDDFDPKNVFNNISWKHDNTFIRKSKLNTLIRFKKYDNITDTKILNTSIINDIKNRMILGELSISKKFNYVQLPIFNFDISGKELQKYDKNIYNKLNANNNSIYHVNILEHFTESISLKDFMKKKLKFVDYQMILFQIFYMIYDIQKSYPYFFHKNFSHNSISVFDNNDNEEKIIKIGDTLFKIPACKFVLKITNFYDTDLNKKESNDLKTFLCSFENIIVDKNMTPVFNFIKEYCHDTQNNDISPLIVLTKNIFFSELITNMNSDYENISSNDINSFRDKQNSINYEISESPRIVTKKVSKNSKNNKNNNNNQIIFEGSRKINNNRYKKRTKSNYKSDNVIAFSISDDLMAKNRSKNNYNYDNSDSDDNDNDSNDNDNDNDSNDNDNMDNSNDNMNDSNDNNDNFDSLASISRSLVLSASFKFAPFLAKPLYCLSNNVFCSAVKSKFSLLSKNSVTFSLSIYVSLFEVTEL